MPTITASSFADPKDVVAYLAAIKQRLPRSEALKVGNDGKGKWGDDTTSDAKAMCALPPEDWEAKWGIGSAARGRKVSVKYRGKTVIGELRDTMPHKPKITNGAGIDLNPGFAKAFGLKPPFLLPGFQWEVG